eukprot:jgi/Bigna1/83789/fgenesh1_pg.115_\
MRSTSSRSSTAAMLLRLLPPHQRGLRGGNQRRTNLLGCTLRGLYANLRRPSSNDGLDDDKVNDIKYDLVVIGGGSGGLAASREAAKLGKTVAVLDYVSPSPRGTMWDIGGTCVNVGCIPKKLLHHAGEVGKSIRKESSVYGWTFDKDEVAFDWEKAISNVQTHIKSINFGYKSALMKEGVKYINAKGTIQRKGVVKARFADGSERELKADHILLAVGGRPKLVDIPGGREHCITSDDIFSMKEEPGSCLVIGASYVALECAGFLTQMGYPTTVMARSDVFLRGFDRDMAREVVEHMAHSGTRFLTNTTPTEVVKSQPQELKQEGGGGEGVEADGTGKSTSGFDRIKTAYVLLHENVPGLESAGVVLNSDSKKVVVDEFDRSSVEGIYAVGDAAEGRPELTPAAIAGGRSLVHRLFSGGGDQMGDASSISSSSSSKSQLLRPCNYEGIATTVFTPLEYACIGKSEEEAAAEIGEDNIDVYHCYFKPLEWSLLETAGGSSSEIGAEDHSSRGYVKCIVDKNDEERVLGLHITGPHAGEIMQGFSVAYNMGMRYCDLVSAVGIHPTSAEEVVGLEVTKASGKDPEKTSC